MRKLLFVIALLVFILPLQAKKNKHSKEKKTSIVEGMILFSSNPFKGNTLNDSKNSFTSAEYIYARLEISSGTLKEAFKIKEDDKTKAFLKCKLTVMQNGEVIRYGSSRDHILLNEESKNGNILNFDILPDPVKANTLYSMLDDFSAGIGFNPISGLIKNGQWPDGNYKVKVNIYYESVNAYGALQDEEKWPFVEGEFDLRFKEDDAPKIMENSKLITENSIENAFHIDNMPPVFSKPGPLTDPNASSIKIAAILKRDLPQRQILKWVAEKYDGPTWHIATDEYNLPKYKYFNPHIWMAYKINGKCYVGYATLRQPYTGGGTYGQLQVAFTSAGSLPDHGIDCNKVK